MGDISDSSETTMERATCPEEQCTAVTNVGQCTIKRVPGSEHCIMHGGATYLKMQEKAAKRNFSLMQWKERVNGFADNDQLKSIREEIGIVRLLLEERLNYCKDNVSLMLHSQPICNLVNQINTLVVSCHKLESSLNQTLDRPTVVRIATEIAEIVSHYVSDADIMDKITMQIATVINQATDMSGKIE